MKILLTIILLLGMGCANATSDVNASKTPLKLIEAQLTVEGMKLGIKSGVSKTCFDSGEAIDICLNELDKIDQLDLKSLLTKVYREVYTEAQMQELYAFYSSESGRKYSQGLLCILASQLDYPSPYQMPSFSAADETSIRDFQASLISQIEQERQSAIEVAINKYLMPVLGNNS
ncbi:DUF2059 domain-containing protein [Aliikangiella marina]|uniref:DUF2059 domain-containing protein n=1 Tax=Aliikangiella marina TaxID=1712262 RepID=A0A545T4D1_9GAMM|nr:DUF2059 domain-containing protein [Aliikangiella marina]TQV72080.1 DUF2059 domain-containing protein [Aliikangiella marina]